MNNFIFRPEAFAFYGLNSYRNMLETPQCEYCLKNCDHRGYIILNDEDELLNWIGDHLLDDGTAIFAYDITGNMYAAIRPMMFEEDEEFDLYTTTDDLTFFKTVDAEYDLHSYGIIIEVQCGKWKVVTV